MGKSALALCMAANLGVRHETPVALFTLEMSKAEVTQRLMCSEAKVESQRLRSGRLAQDDWPRLTAACDKLMKAPIYVDDTGSITMMELRSARRLKSREPKLGMIIVDYLPADDLGLEPREPSAGGLADLAPAEGASRAISGADHRALPALRAVEQRQEARRSSPTSASPARSSRTPTSSPSSTATSTTTARRSDSQGLAEIILAKHRNGPTDCDQAQLPQALRQVLDLAAASPAPVRGRERPAQPLHATMAANVVVSSPSEFARAVAYRLQRLPRRRSSQVQGLRSPTRAPRRRKQLGVSDCATRSHGCSGPRGRVQWSFEEMDESLGLCAPRSSTSIASGLPGSAEFFCGDGAAAGYSGFCSSSVAEVASTRSSPTTGSIQAAARRLAARDRRWPSVLGRVGRASSLRSTGAFRRSTGRRRAIDPISPGPGGLERNALLRERSVLVAGRGVRARRRCRSRRSRSGSRPPRPRSFPAVRLTTSSLPGSAERSGQLRQNCASSASDAFSAKYSWLSAFVILGRVVDRERPQTGLAVDDVSVPPRHRSGSSHGSACRPGNRCHSAVQ
jgi:hypothetical protein